MIRSTFCLALCAAAAAAAFSTHNLLDYGADASGATDASPALRAALAAIAADGGGTLLLPRGTYSLKPFNLTSNSALVLDDATIVASDAPGDFALVPALPSYGEGRDKLPNDRSGRYQPFIGIYYASNVSITTSSAGYIHGSGAAWWQAKDKGTLNNTPPHLIEAGWSRDLAFGAPAGSPLNALSFINSPFWNLHIYDCDNSYGKEERNTY